MSISFIFIRSSFYYLYFQANVFKNCIILLFVIRRIMFKDDSTIQNTILRKCQWSQTRTILKSKTMFFQLPSRFIPTFRFIFLHYCVCCNVTNCLCTFMTISEVCGKFWNSLAWTTSIGRKFLLTFWAQLWARAWARPCGERASSLQCAPLPRLTLLEKETCNKFIWKSGSGSGSKMDPDPSTYF